MQIGQFDTVPFCTFTFSPLHLWTTKLVRIEVHVAEILYEQQEATRRRFKAIYP